MAKKLIYNYTFTPGVANVGKIEIDGNYPAKVWQLVTDVGTNGLYPHIFVRDEYAATTGAIEIISGGSGNLIVSETGTSFDGDTGIFTVTTTTNHGLSTGATIKFRLLGVTFTCSKDNHTTEHSYPRTTDPVYDTALPITQVDGNTFTVDVGRPFGGAISSNNEIIYNFADSSKGGSTYYNSLTNITTLTLKHDTSHLDPKDDLQIFVDIQEEKMDFSETFLDPVNKLRVSEPQNLIDTDFEYGLQPTKWETVELVNNIPSFYASNSDYTLANILLVSTVSGSENITVTTQEAHNLTVGSPIDVQGVSSRTAEGKFLITAVPSSTSFVYKSKGPQASTGTINGAYTTIIPGQFYVGSEIALDKSKGVYTNEAQPSKLAFNTDYTHGLDQGTSVYVTNTIGKEKYNLTVGLGSTAPDGRPYVDFSDTLNVNLTVNSALTETKQMTGTYSVKFASSAVNTTDNTITWTNHQLQQGDVVLYIPPSGDTAVGGLQRFQVYYVKTTPTANTITLCETTNGDWANNAVIDITSQGTSTYGRHQLILGYEISYASKNNNQYETYFYTRNYWLGNGSGRDLGSFYNDTSSGRSGYFGLGQTYPSRVMIAQKGSPTMSTIIHAAPIYSTRDNANFTFGKAGTTPDGYDFIEDYQRYENFYYQNNYYSYYQFQPRYFYAAFLNNFDYSNGSSQSYTNGTTFAFFLKRDTESDSLFIDNHGLSSGSLATLTTNSGSAPTNRTETGTWYSDTPVVSTLSGVTTSTVTVVSPNRIRLASITRLESASGTYTLTGSVTNPTANSIYLGPNNLVTNQNLYLSAGPSGFLPPTTSGVVQPVSNTIATVYSSLTSALNSIKSTMGSDTWEMVQTGFNHQTPISANFLTTSSGIQYINVQRSSLYLNRYSSSTGFSGVSANLPTTGFANGQSFDPFTGTTVSGLGYNMISTPYTSNTTIPYWVDLFQVPYEPGVQYSEFYYNSWFIYNYGQSGTLDNRNDSYTSWTSLSNGWRYHYDTNYIAPFGSGSYHGYICMVLTIDNSNWSGYYSTPNPSIYFPGSQYMAAYTFGYMGQRYTAHIIIPVKAGTTSSRYGTSGTNLTNAQIASTIATEISNALVNPTFSGSTNQLARSEVISGNRIRLRTATTNNNYNFIGFGTAPISIETDEVVGVLDGYYGITNSTATTAEIQLTTQIPKRIVGFTSANVVNVGGDLYINSIAHKLDTTQEVVFNILSNSNGITGLTSGTTYYAAPRGPNYISLATTKANATAGNFVSLATTATGTFNLVSASISGIASGPGSVGIKSDSTTFTGTGTLFKRFFKSGDIIKIEDKTLTPSRYKEFQVASVVDDTLLSVSEVPGVTITSTPYFVDTKVNVRPDGTFLHRPFDGGVEITAGTSPNSSIARQTRKYFRYQSGKGIQCSLAINFNPSRVANSAVGLGSTAVITTRYPHGLTTNNRVTIRGATDSAFNGTFDIIDSDSFTFKYQMATDPTTSIADGIVEYNIDSWANSVIRAGLFDYQNGFFFEFDGSTLYAVRRSSVQQLPGTARVTTGSNIVLGESTNFDGQLSVGSYIVLRGNSYKITRLVSNTEMHIQPAYKGVSASDVIVTKTVDTRVPQNEWNIDKADGNGPSGFLLDTTKIQMAYLDYSWYGAGKIRFGFKDTYGHVKYMHEFRHNNRLEEAYMRSGNVPGRYEIENIGTPTYVPSLFHWGTSVIMDGRFDDDKAYLFTASSNSLIFTNGASVSATANQNSDLYIQYNYSLRTYDWYVRLFFPVADAAKFTTGTPLYTSTNSLKGEKVAFTQYSGSSILVYIFIQSSFSTPAVYPYVPSTTVVNIGAPASGGNTVDLTKDVPLISIRLAPSVDNNLTGSVGQREIINRMQLQLKSLGMTLSHDCEVDMILNGSITNLNFTPVNSPSLSQLLRHSAGDQIIGGTIIFSLRASGGTTSGSVGSKRLSATTDFDLSQITDLGNAMLGGDGVYPNGPDLLTIAIKPVDTSEINAVTPLSVSSRITWTESQA